MVLRTQGGEVMTKEVRRRSPKQIELRSLNPEHGDRIISAADIAWMARVMWVKQ